MTAGLAVVGGFGFATSLPGAAVLAFDVAAPAVAAGLGFGLAGLGCSLE